MKFDKEVLDKIMLYLEESISINVDKTRPFYSVRSIAIETAVDSINTKSKSDWEIYYALHYAAKRGLIEVEWCSNSNGINTVKDITPEGHKYIQNLKTANER